MVSKSTRQREATKKGSGSTAELGEFSASIEHVVYPLQNKSRNEEPLSPADSLDQTIISPSMAFSPENQGKGQILRYSGLSNKLQKK